MEETGGDGIKGVMFLKGPVETLRVASCWMVNECSGRKEEKEGRNPSTLIAVY